MGTPAGNGGYSDAQESMSNPFLTIYRKVVSSKAGASLAAQIDCPYIKA